MDNNELILTEQNDLNIHKHINHTDINNNNNTNNTKQQQQPHCITQTQTNTTPSLHIHKPVPKSKLQKAEDKYFSLKAEIHSNIFSSSSTTPPSNIQMLSYLEKLNTVLSEIITNTKLTNKQNARLRRAQQDAVPTAMIDQDQLNDNNQKLIIVYKKQYSLLKAKLSRITKENFLLNLEQERKAIDNELNALHAETKKLQNEQKLNDITLSKITKGTNKSEIELKRLVMDYESLKRQKTSIVNKLNNKKQLYEDNDMKITQLNEFHERLESIAKDMYHITEYGNVKDKEMNVQKKEKYRKNLIYKINILDKAIISNQKRFVSESKQNIKKIMELRIQKEMMIEKYVNDGGKYEEEDNEDVLRMEREYKEEEREEKEKEKDKEEVKREEKEEVLKEIEKLFMERDKERNEGEKYVNKINEDNGGNKECVEDKKVLVENKEEDKDNEMNEHEECDKDSSGVEDMLVTHNDKNAEDDDNKEIENNVPEFLEGFVDNKSNVIQNGNLDVNENNNNKNDLQISHEAVKSRKQKIEIIQKEYKETNSTNTNNNNNENTDQLPKQSTNEYEELEEFQI
jgi:hypothetical protein